MVDARGDRPYREIVLLPLGAREVRPGPPPDDGTRPSRRLIVLRPGRRSTCWCLALLGGEPSRLPGSAEEEADVLGAEVRDVTTHSPLDPVLDRTQRGSVRSPHKRCGAPRW